MEKIYSNATQLWTVIKYLVLVGIRGCGLVIGALGIVETAWAEGLADEPVPSSWANEAALHDVCFINPRQGWAVGDHGVILRTIDGGENWQTLQDIRQTLLSHHRRPPTQSLTERLRGVSDKINLAPQATFDADIDTDQVTCRLSSVFFLNATDGWAVGGYQVPYFDRTRAVVLRTRDGGDHWQVVSGITTPNLRQVQFSTPQSGWAIGDASPQSPTGIYYSHDGGSTWNSQPPNSPPAIAPPSSTETETAASAIKNTQNSLPVLHHWIRGSEFGGQVTAISTTGVLRGIGIDQVENLAVLGRRQESFRDLLKVNETEGWAVGTNGAVFQTTDGGRSWRQPKSLNTEEITEALHLIDFQTVTAAGDNIWAAGKPGACFISINRKTGSVAFHPAPANTAIHRIQFVDAQHGYAVGDLGMILATDDSGKSWFLQRGRQRRLAVLSICFDSSEVPLELLAQHACEENFLTGIAMVTQTGDTQQAVERVNLQQAVGRCGNAVLCGIDLPETKTVETRRTALLHKLVAVIRQNQPSCVVLNSSPYLGQAIIERKELVTQAIHMAADARVKTEYEQRFKLKPWQVQRLAFADIAGHAKINSSKFLPRLEDTIEGRIMVSRSLLGHSIQRNQKVAYRMVRFLGRGAGGQSTTVVPLQRNDLLTGLVTAPQRTGESWRAGTLSSIGKFSRKQQAFKRLLAMRPANSKDWQHWQNEMFALTHSVAPREAGNWLLELADDYFQTGQPGVASRVLQTLIGRWPNHAYAQTSRLWLAAYFASDEFNQLAYRQWVKSHAADSAPVHTAGLNSNDRTPAKRLDRARATSVEFQPAIHGQQELAWVAQDKNYLNQQIAEARKARAVQQAGHLELAEEDRDEVERLLELGASLGGRPNPTSDSTLDLSELDLEPKVTGQSKATGQSKVTADTRLNSNGVDSGTVRQANHVTAEVMDAATFFQKRRQQSFGYLTELRSYDPGMVDDPQVCLTEIALLNHSVDRQAKENRLRHLRPRALLSGLMGGDEGPVQAIDQELKLINNPEVAQAGFACIRASERPQLDGKFNDAVWSDVLQQKRYRLLPVRGVSPPTSDVLFAAYDDHFFYLIARINKRPGYTYDWKPKPRPRDANLDGRDRIEIELDTDRDRRTGYRFEIDHRGWLREGLSGVRAWNPTWYVAQQEDERTWTVEAAIPLAEITAQSNAAQSSIAQSSTDKWTTTWRLGLRRPFVRNVDLWQNRSSVSKDGLNPVKSNSRPSGALLDWVVSPRGGQLVGFE